MELNVQELTALGPVTGAPGLRGHWRNICIGCQGDVVLPILWTKSGYQLRGESLCGGVTLISLAFCVFDYFYLSIFNVRDAETTEEMKWDMNKLQTVDPSESLWLGYLTLSHPGDMFMLPQQ